MLLRLPDELIILILSELEPIHVAAAQAICRHLARLGRDTELWKRICFDQSSQRAHARRLQRLQAQQASLTALGQAARSLARDEIDTSDCRIESPTRAQKAQARSMADWDPSRGTHIDFYSEFKARHGPIDVHWLPNPRSEKSPCPLEALGVGIVYEHSGLAQAAVAPIADGSVSLWSLPGGTDRTSNSEITRSRIGLLSLPGSRQPPSFDGAVDNVTIDSQSQKAYFAVQDHVLDLDLRTMQIVRRTRFPFSVTALSEACAHAPITVGTSNTLHCLDSRSRRLANGTEIDGGHASLSQPGPQCILHLDTDIWVAGRFSSLLLYDRRFWPRVRGTIFSGARLSSLCALGSSHLPREYSLLRDPGLSINQYQATKSTPGTTLVACGEYNGKGSLELHGIKHAGHAMTPPTCYQNRQTASKSRLLSVAKHGCRLVFSDGDGELRWLEQDATTFVRAININDANFCRYSAADKSASAFGPTQSEGDIVQKIVPISAGGECSNGLEDLLLWTGDQLALVGFRRNVLAGQREESNHEHEPEAQRLYESHMRRALERQAAEAFFIQRLGLQA